MLKQILLTLILFNLHTYADSMLVNPHDPLSDRDLLDEFFDKVIQTVKEHPHRINEANEDGYTLLQLALINNSHIDDKISVMQNKNGTTQNTLEISRTIIKILLNNGADPNIPFPADNSQGNNKHQGQHFLIKATEPNVWPYFPLYIVNLLFEYGLDDQVRDANDNTALMRLVSSRYAWRKISKYRKDFIQIVVNHTSNFNTQNKKGDMVLHLTSHFNDLETARLIIENPVQLDIKNNQGKTPEETAKFMAGPFPSDQSNRRWGWHFSLSSTSYLMVKLLQEETERRQSTVTSTDPNTENQNSVDTKRTNPLPATSCKRAFNGEVRNTN